MADRQLVLVSDPALVPHYSSLSQDWEVRYSNGSIPSDAKDFKNALTINPDPALALALCEQLSALACPRIVWSTANLTQCSTWPEAVDTLKASGINQYFTVSAHSQPLVESSPAPRPEPKVAESSPKPAESTQAHDSGDWTTQVAPEGAETPTGPFKKRQRPRLAAIDGNLARAPDPDDEPLPASLSEDALSEHFVETRGEKWRYVPEWATWLEWRGDGWHRDTLSKVAHECKEITRECLTWREAGAGPWGPALSPDGKRKISSRRMAWAVRDMAAVHPKISVLAEELDRDPMLLGVPGGVVDLRTGKLLEPDPEDYITRRTSVAPVEGPHPLFDRVLQRAENGHEGMRAYLLRCLGMCLTGRVNEEVFFCLVGKGGAGKGSLTRALQAIVGDYGDTIAIEALLETKHARHPQEIAKLQGVRIVFSHEPEEGCKFNSGLIQSLTSSEPLTAHRMRCDDVTFTPTHKIIISMNALPGLKSVSDGAMKRRLHIIQYAEPLSEEDRDTTLKERMIAEYPAILHTLIQGCVDWQDCAGLGKPESVVASVDEYLENEDNFAEFISSCIENVASHTGERSSVVYKRYLDWCDAEGEKYPMALKRFVQTMRARGYESSRTAAGKMINGLKLLAPPPAEPGRQYQDRD